MILKIDPEAEFHKIETWCDDPSHGWVLRQSFYSTAPPSSSLTFISPALSLSSAIQFWHTPDVPGNPRVFLSTYYNGLTFVPSSHVQFALLCTAEGLTKQRCADRFFFGLNRWKTFFNCFWEYPLNTRPYFDNSVSLGKMSRRVPLQYLTHGTNPSNSVQVFSQP